MAERGPSPPSRGPGAIAAFLGLVVAFNSIVYSCSNDRLSRENAQVQRLAAREKFWTDAMEDLSALVAERGRPDYDQEVWDKRCRLLALRTSPFTTSGAGDGQPDEGQESMSARAKADQSRVALLELAFTQRMQDDQLVTGTCRDAFARRQFDAAQAEADVSAEVGPPTSAAPAGGAIAPAPFQGDVVSASAIQQRANIIALTPQSPTGWDIDVFWCDRADQASATLNYDDAVAVAKRLAGLAQAGEKVGGQLLGRIRARILPIALQGRNYFPNEGATVRADGGVGEMELARSLAASMPEYGFQTGGASRRRTRWYLSMFLCRAPAGR